MQKLIILPGNCDTLGGTLVSLSALIAGAKKQNNHQYLCVLVQANSPMEKYLQRLELDFCLQPIHANSQKEFFQQSLKWVYQQPLQYPLLLDNCAYNYLLPTFLINAPLLRLSGRTVYYFCHDLVGSNNILGYLARKCIFSFLSPFAICNSHFTAQNVRHFMSDVKGVLYQPVCKEIFNNTPIANPPKALQPILESGFRIMLTPSRLNKHPKDGENCDKNLRTLIPVLAHLKAMGYNYHAVVIGEDKSPNQINSSILLKKAEEFGVADRFTILPAIIAIEDYYKCADIVVTLAHKEAFGRIVVEAIACGVAVVGSNNGGIGEILGNCAPEWMVNPDDPLAAAKTIINIANNPNTPKTLANAKSWVDKYCSIEEYASKMMEITGILTSYQKIQKYQKTGSFF